ncbi:arginase [Vibrio sp. JPW-9-11-11]|uniref:arginase family protein n=1 Tax=Vibrio sp. JPW-9-11-11 TaxID=1416532 RepID=UPI0015935DD5|nr:arginase family protein [Vibrio sp. JPW-9-11-11]NVD08657.1 arginase [Vibrio sp. JPW-9-11-11]
MFGLFRRHNKLATIGLTSHRLAMLSVSEKLKPMTQVEFEMANQSLEEMFQWVTDSQGQHWFNAGHFNLSTQASEDYQLKLSHCLGSQAMPVVLTNHCETLLHTLPLIHASKRELGIVHIGRQFELKPSLDLQQGSAFHFALSRYGECRLFCLGIDAQLQNDQVWEYAEDLGCDWLTLDECSFLHRFQVKQQLATYLGHCDDVIVNIDLNCLYPATRLEGYSALEVQMVNRMLRQLLLSSKVRLVQLVGYTDKHLYSKPTQSILHELGQLTPFRDRAA